jgi:hypothetical protein
MLPYYEVRPTHKWDSTNFPATPQELTLSTAIRRSLVLNGQKEESNRVLKNTSQTKCHHLPCQSPASKRPKSILHTDGDFLSKHRRTGKSCGTKECWDYVYQWWYGCHGKAWLISFYIRSYPLSLQIYIYDTSLYLLSQHCVYFDTSPLSLSHLMKSSNYILLLLFSA